MNSLHNALNDKKLFLFLIENKANVHDVDDQGLSILDYACRVFIKNQNNKDIIDIIEVLEKLNVTKFDN